MFRDDVMPSGVYWLMIQIATAVMWWAFARMLSRL